jgi:hypothetical protein
MVIEMIPWSSSLGLNKWLRTLFSVWKSAVLKRQSKEYHIHRCKNWISRSCGFRYDAASVSPTVAFAQWLGRPLAYRGSYSLICQGTLPNMPQLADFGGFYYNSAPNPLAHRAVTAVICNRRTNLCANRQHSPMDCKPSHSKIRRIWWTGFYIVGCTTVRTVALRRPIYKWKKGFATISLGLIYHSMALSQPPSGDTVP